MYVTGLIAFLLFFLHDFNDWKLGIKGLRICFPAGAVLLIAVTISMCIPLDQAVVQPVWGRVLLGAAGLGLVWAEMYSLLFSFSNQEAYGNAALNQEARSETACLSATNRTDTGIETEGKGRRLCTDRMYKLCRHPGVLFFILLYLDLWLCMGMDLPGMAMLCILNLLLAAFEDIIVFPRVFSRYDEYRKTTPFLVPSGKSIRGCIGDFRRRR